MDVVSDKAAAAAAAAEAEESLITWRYQRINQSKGEADGVHRPAAPPP
jgi:hypothetical protein